MGLGPLLGYRQNRAGTDCTCDRREPAKRAVRTKQLAIHLASLTSEYPRPMRDDYHTGDDDDDEGDDDDDDDEFIS